MVAPLVAAAGVSALGSIAGGILGGQAAKKAAKIQAGANQAALQHQERAASQVRQLHEPGVIAYRQGVNALAGRLGFDPTPISAAIEQAGPRGAFDATGYLEAYPDVMAGFQAAAPRNLTNNLGIEATPEAYAQWHYGQYGQFEGRSPNGQPVQRNALAPASTYKPGYATYGVTPRNALAAG